MDQQQMCLILLKVKQHAFTQASFSSLSDIHKCSSSLQMTPSFLDKQTANCNLPHDWLISLAMDLAAWCDMWRWKWHQWMPFDCFSEDVTFAATLSLPTCSPPSHLIEVLVVLATPVKILSKMAGNSASYPVYSRHSELPWIAI